MSCNSINGGITDIRDWISALPAASDWQTNDKSFKLCNASQASLLFSAIKKPGSRGSEDQVIFSLLVDFQFPIPLWTSDPCRLGPKEEALYDLFLNFIAGILSYSPQNWRLDWKAVDLAKVMRSNHSQGMFRCAFLALVLCVCFYEAPGDIRSCCVDVVERELEKEVKIGDYWKAMLEAVGSKIEEQVMRSMALLITNRIFRASKESEDLAWVRSQIMRIRLPCSYSTSTKGLWQVRVYSPVLGMRTVDKHHSSKDDRLAVALSYLHLEAVLQLSYDLIFTANWIEVRVKVDNVRCDVVPLISGDAMEEESGVTDEEKHFPSRVSVNLGPAKESQLLAVSVDKSSANPSYEMSSERSLEAGFEPPGMYAGVKFTGTEGSTVSMKAWKMEQSVEGSQGAFDWALYDTLTAKQVASSRPSKMEWMQPKAWFKDRYSSAFTPFTRQGGVVFAWDEYPQGITWKLKADTEGKIMRWEVGGSICVTYWPNKYRTFFCETRQLNFSEPVELPLIRSSK